jgi:hypothetical protein
MSQYILVYLNTTSESAQISQNKLVHVKTKKKNLWNQTHDLLHTARLSIHDVLCFYMVLLYIE